MGGMIKLHLCVTNFIHGNRFPTFTQSSLSHKRLRPNDSTGIRMGLCVFDDVASEFMAGDPGAADGLCRGSMAVNAL